MWVVCPENGAAVFLQRLEKWYEYLLDARKPQNRRVPVARRDSRAASLWLLPQLLVPTRYQATGRQLLTLLGLQFRFGYKLLGNGVDGPQNGTAVVKGLIVMPDELRMDDHVMMIATNRVQTSYGWMIMLVMMVTDVDHITPLDA